MMYYAKLRGKIREVYLTNRRFAAAMQMDYSALSNKLNKKSPWKEEEIVKACSLLKIPIQEVWMYFFNEEVVI